MRTSTLLRVGSALAIAAVPGGLIASLLVGNPLPLVATVVGVPVSLLLSEIATDLEAGSR